MGLLDRAYNQRRAPKRLSAPTLFEQDTRQAAIRRLNAGGKLPERQQMVLRALADLGPATMKMVSAHIHLPINCVTGRFKELFESGQIEKCGKIVDMDSGYTAQLYRLKK
jgi:hypothetical protein